MFCQIASASVCVGSWSTYEYVFSKRRDVLSTERVEKLVYIHGTPRNISSGKTFTISATKPGSSLLNYLRNEM